MLGCPTSVDPEVASATFKRHLDELWASGRCTRLGWEITHLDPLHVVVALPAKRPDGTADRYFVKMGAEYYDAFPPTVAFVNPENWTEAANGTRWFPVISPFPPWFGLHPSYGFPNGTSRQLVCFSFTAEYYMTSHSPPADAVWRQGRHTISATLNRLAEVLCPPYYQCPSG